MAAPAVPARLAMPSWASRLAEATGGRSVQVALGDDGSVRLQTIRDADGMTVVNLRFSDPDLQALAGAHAGRLREALDAHFAEPVRLSLGDGSAAGGSFSDTGERAGQAPNSHTLRTSSHTGAPAASRADSGRTSAAVPSGRREWIG